MNLRTSLLCLVVTAPLLVSGVSFAASVHDNMLASVVFVGCDVELEGQPLLAASGSAFLIASSEYVITNNHAQSPAIRGRAGEYAGRSIPIPLNGLILGREAAGEAGLLFNENSGVSRKHCFIVYVEGPQRFEVTDFGSTNGTFALPGEKRLPAHQTLVCKAGQIIRLGRQNEFELVLQ